MVKSRYIGDGHPTFNRNPYHGYINLSGQISLYIWVSTQKYWYPKMDGWKSWLQPYEQMDDLGVYTPIIGNTHMEKVLNQNWPCAC